MIAVIKDACIFMVAAQAVLLFVPGKIYEKYVRILIGIIMILKITEPVFGLLMDEGQKQALRSQTAALEHQLEAPLEETEWGEGRMSIYEGIEEELRSRLMEEDGAYEVVRVELAGRKGTEISWDGFDSLEKVIITVRERNVGQEEYAGQMEKIEIEQVIVGASGKEPGEAGGENTDELKKNYGDRLGIDETRIEIRYE